MLNWRNEMSVFYMRRRVLEVRVCAFWSNIESREHSKIDGWIFIFTHGFPLPRQLLPTTKVIPLIIIFITWTQQHLLLPDIHGITRTYFHTHVQSALTQNHVFCLFLIRRFGDASFELVFSKQRVCENLNKHMIFIQDILVWQLTLNRISHAVLSSV